jgi:elongation factor G
VLSDFTRRRGRIEGLDQIGTLREVHAVAPLAAMFGYANDLRSCTQGRASHSMEFWHYEEVQTEVANEIMEHTGSLYRFG